MEFEYDIIDNMGNKIKYTATNHGGGGTAAKCKKGQTISIRYLPESPEIARHSRNINFSTYTLIALCSFAVAIGITCEAIKGGIVPKEDK